MTDDDALSPAQPAGHHAQTARQLLDLHRRLPEPSEAYCWWCMRRWPCADVRWSVRMLRRALTAKDTPAIRSLDDLTANTFESDEELEEFLAFNRAERRRGIA